MSNFLTRFKTPLVVVTTILLALYLIRICSPYSASLFSAVPSQAVLVGYHSNFIKSTMVADSAQSLAWKNMTKTTLAVRTQETVHALLTLFKSKPDWVRTLAAAPMLTANAFTPADSLHALIALKTGKIEGFSRYLETELSKTVKVFEYTNNGNQIYNIHTPDGRKITVAHKHGLVLVSRFAYLVEESLALLVQKDNWWKQFDAAILPEAAYWVRTERLAAHLQSVASPIWKQHIRFLLDNSTWIKCYLQDGEANIALGEAGLLKRFLNYAEPMPFQMATVLPDHTAFFLGGTFSNKNFFFHDLANGDLSHFSQYMKPWVGNAYGWIMTDPVADAMALDQAIVLSVKDDKKAQQSLASYGKAHGLLKQYDYNTFQVFQCQNNDIIKPLIIHHSIFQHPCIAILGQYAIIAPTTTALETCIDKYIVNQTLAQHPVAVQCFQKLPPEASMHGFLNAGSLPIIIENLLEKDDPVGDLIGQVFENQQFGVAVSQDQQIHTNSVAVKSQSKNRDATIGWKIKLEAPVAGNPILRLDAEQNPVVFVQDLRHNLYCIDLQGKIRWTRKLSGKLLSEWQEIDYQRNKGRCYIGNTADELYIMDTDGRDLPGYPLPLSPNATNGLIVSHSPASTDCFFFAKTDGNIYGYDYHGAPLSGWNPCQIGQIIRQPLTHFIHQNRDYCCAIAESGQLYGFDKSGRPHFKTQNLEGRFRSPLMVNSGRKSIMITAVNTNGVFWNVSPGGQKYAYDNGENPTATLFAPVGGDERWDYVTASNNAIKAVNFDGTSSQAVYKTTIRDKIDDLFGVSHGYLGARSPTLKKIWLYNSTGKLHPGFPLAGDTRFLWTNNKQKKKTVVVGLDDYLYAYRVE